MYFPTKKAFTNRKYLLKPIKNKSLLTTVLTWKRENKTRHFIADSSFSSLKTMPIMLNICEEKRITSFRPLVNLNTCLCEAKKKNSYSRNKIPMAAFAWAKEVTVGSLQHTVKGTHIHKTENTPLFIWFIAPIDWKTKRVFRSDK